jgi:hypothetical protein
MALTLVVDPPDAKIFYKLEDWVPNADAPSTTEYLSRVAEFQRHNALSAYQAAGGVEKDTSSTRKTVSPSSSMRLVPHIRG